MKSFDIKPKKTASKPIFPQQTTKVTRTVTKTKRGLWPKVTALVVVLAVLTSGLLAFYVLPEARIQVQARSEAVTRDMDMRVDKNQLEPSQTKLTIPGRLLEQELTGTKSYQSTGSKNVGKTASGFVSIYNFSKTTLILRAATTALTINGKGYHFTQDVGGIRPTAFIGIEDQEVDPSSLVPPVPVVADAPGTIYNLPKGSRLEIENEAFGKQPKTLYALVAEDISGGTDKEVKIVTDKDISNAHAALTKELIKSARTQIETKSAGSVVLDNAVSADVSEPKSSVVSGTEIPVFEVSLKVKIKAFVYDQRDVKSLIEERIKRLLPEDKILLDNPENTKILAQFANVSLDQGLGTLVVHYEGLIVYKVDRGLLMTKVRGKSVDEIREILLSRPEIDSAKVTFYPFWVKRAPQFMKKIDLEVVNAK